MTAARMGEDGPVGGATTTSRSRSPSCAVVPTELAVLNDLARRLAALHDTREVLDEVARQARRLLGVDVAYIMLLRADRLRIEVVDGAMGSAMRGIELESGQGLGGQILATGRPLSSERYLEDTRFPHGEGTDAAALSEQLGGILGVPLVVGDDTLGVLLAADRRPRAFGDRDVELLAGLAAHAALALRTADLFDRERAAAAELRSANETLRAVNESRQRASDLRDVLNDIVIRGEGLAAVVAALERSAGPVGGGPRPPRPRPSRASRRPRAGSSSRSTCRAGTAATSWPRRRSRPTRRPCGCCGSAPRTVAVLMASERSVAEAELRTRGEFVHALLSSDADEASLLRRARAIGVDLHAVTTVAVVDAEPVGGTAAAAFAARLAAELARVVGRPCRPGRRAPPRRRRPGPRNRHSAERPGRRHPDDGTGRRRGRAARGAVGRTKRRGRRRPCCSPSAAPGPPPRATSWACTARCSAARGGPGSRPSSTSTVGPLLAYDDEHQRDLAATLETYLSRPGTTPAPAPSSTSTPTPSTSGSTGSPRCSARGGRSRTAHSSCRWPCACTAFSPTTRG